MSESLITKMRGVRGATTATANTIEAMQDAITELLAKMEQDNQLDWENVASVIFTATPDLDAIFPAAVARKANPRWGDVPLLDVQQMQVEGSLEKCIRVLIHWNTTKSQEAIRHIYLRGAAYLRPDLAKT